jgi:hypothetical protein
MTETVGVNEVRLFGSIMLLELNRPENVAKGGWKNLDNAYFIKRIDEEFAEARAAIDEYERLKRVGASDEELEEARGNVLKELADVANFCVMCADANKCLGLPE